MILRYVCLREIGEPRVSSIVCKRNRASISEVTLGCRRLDIETTYFLIVSYGEENDSPASSNFGTRGICSDLHLKRVRRIIKKIS